MTWKSILESSTIHGLSHITTPNRLVRLFWILTVLTGFSIAFMIIEQSFRTWSENPITTTIETLPVSALTLPKITVCPPKNSFTNLNYDLVDYFTHVLNQAPSVLYSADPVLKSNTCFISDRRLGVYKNTDFDNIKTYSDIRKKILRASNFRHRMTYFPSLFYES